MPEQIADPVPTVAAVGGIRCSGGSPAMMMFSARGVLRLKSIWASDLLEIGNHNPISLSAVISLLQAHGLSLRFQRSYVQLRRSLEGSHTR